MDKIHFDNEIKPRVAKEYAKQGSLVEQLIKEYGSDVHPVVRWWAEVADIVLISTYIKKE